MAPEAGASHPAASAAGAAFTARVDALRTDILGVLDALQQAADQLFDHVLAEQLLWARQAVERLAPLVDERLTEGRSAAGAVLGQATRLAPYAAAARQHPWLLMGGALLVSYLGAGGGSRAPTPRRPRRGLSGHPRHPASREESTGPCWPRAPGRCPAAAPRRRP